MSVAVSYIYLNMLYLNSYKIILLDPLASNKKKIISAKWTIETIFCRSAKFRDI